MTEIHEDSLLAVNPRRAEELRERRLETRQADVVAARCRALSDPTRVSLAASLGEGDELCVCDLAAISGRSQNLVSHHLQSLRAEGIVTSRRQGKMVMYRLTDEGRSLLRAALDRVRPATETAR